jgi:hypothetical protein
VRYNSDIQYRSWQAIHDDIDTRNIEEPPITKTMMHHYIDTISSVAHKTFFSSPQIDRITQDINQIKWWDPERNPGIGHAFFDDIREHAELIEEVKLVPGSEKLFKTPGIFTNKGAYSQFLLTIWLSRHLSVEDLELNNNPLNTDVLCKVDSTSVHFHIKDIEEDERHDRVDDTVWVIESFFVEEARKARAEKFLAVLEFDGVPPKKINEQYWINLIRSWPRRPHTQTVVFEPSEETGNQDKVTVNIKLGWRPWNSTHISPSAPFNNAVRFAYEFNTLADKLNKCKSDKSDIHILIALTWDTYNAKEDMKQLATEPAGYITVMRFGYELDRSPVILPQNLGLRKLLEQLIPERYKLI